jgi:hypothetical protein
MIKPSPDQILSWIKIHFKDYKPAKHGREIRVNNPFSIDDDYHLWINIQKGIVNDFRPNYKGDVAGTFLSFVMKFRSIGFKAAVSEVMGDDVRTRDIFYVDEDAQKGPECEVALPTGFKKFIYDDDRISATAKRYLNRRCISNGKIYAMGMGYVGANVVFPYREFGKTTYWQQRSILNKTFLFPDESNKSRHIYGLDNIDPTDPVIVTESIFNSLMFENAVAIGGSDMSDDQKHKLKKLKVKKVILAFDNDKAGKAGIVKAYDKMNAYFDLFYSLPNDEKDWNDVAQIDGLEAPLKMLKRNVKKLDFKAMVSLKIK